MVVVYFVAVVNSGSVCVCVCDTAVIKPCLGGFGDFIFDYCFRFLHLTSVVFGPSGVTALLSVHRSLLLPTHPAIFLSSVGFCWSSCRLSIIHPHRRLLSFYFYPEVRFCLGLTLNSAFMSALTLPPSSAFVSSPHLLYRRWSER